MRGRAASPSPAQLALSTASGPTRAAHRWYLQKVQRGERGQPLDALERILEVHACHTGGGSWWAHVAVHPPAGGRRWSVFGRDPAQKHLPHGTLIWHTPETYPQPYNPSHRLISTTRPPPNSVREKTARAVHGATNGPLSHTARRSQTNDVWACAP
jgi:hypothetical protein